MHGPRQHVVHPVTRFPHQGLQASSLSTVAEAAKPWLAGTVALHQLGRVVLVLPRMRQADSTLHEP